MLIVYFVVYDLQYWAVQHLSTSPLLIVVAGSYIAAGVPDITGTFSASGTVRPTDLWGVSGACAGTIRSGASASMGEFGAGDLNFTFSASNSNAIYGAANTVQPASLKIQYLIRY